MADVDTVVVGAGVMGAATAWQLARAGREVVVLEQFQVGHAQGSSHGRARVFRFAYEDPMYVRMAMEAKSLWRELERDIGGERVLIETGGVDVGPDLSRITSALARCGATFDRLSAEEAARRFPWLRFRPGESVVYHQDAGVAAADRALGAFLRAALAYGARLLERTPVLHLSIEGGGAIVRTADGTFRARAVVVTAGPWARGLLNGAGVDVDVSTSRETVAFFPVAEEPLTTLVDWSDHDHPSYALPSPGQGLKAGAHHTGPDAEPDGEGAVSDETVALLSKWVSERFPAADPMPDHAETCMYTNTADERFILERHGPIVIGSACSGHGFKFAPLIGKRLAELSIPP